MSNEAPNQPKPKKKSCLSQIINLLFIAGIIVGLYFAYQYFFGNPATEEPVTDNQTQETQVEGTSDASEDAIEVETMEITDDPLARINFQKVGTVTPYKSATLTAETNGILKDFKVEEGDLVVKEEELAKISDSVSTEIAQINYESSLDSLENAKRSLNSTEDSISQDKVSTQIGVQTAQLNYENAIEAYNNLTAALEAQIRSSHIAVQGAQIGLSAAQEAYFNSTTTTNISLQNTLDQSLSSINSSLSLVDSSVDAAESVLIYESTLNNEVSSSKLNNIEDDVENIHDEYLDLLEEYYDVQGSQNAQEIKNLLDDTLELLEDTQMTLVDLKNVIDEALDSDDSEIETIKSMLSPLKVSLNTLISSMDQSKSGLYMSKQTIDSMIINNQLQPEGSLTSLEAAQAQLTAAMQALEIAEANRESQLDNAQNGIELAAKQVDSARAQLANIDAKGELQKIGAESQVNMAQTQSDIAEANLGGTTVDSPLDGIVIEKFVDEGNYVSPTQRIITVADMSKVQIIVSLTSEELSFVKLGQSVTILAPGGIKAQGKISKVLPTVDAVSKKVKVKIIIPNEDNKFVSGMFTDVLFTEAQQGSPAIYVPFKSVLFEQNNTYVYVVENNKAIKKTVKLGQISGSNVEITDGLSQGDIIITSGAKLVNEGSQVTVKSE